MKAEDVFVLVGSGAVVVVAWMLYQRTASAQVSQLQLPSTSTCGNYPPCQS